MHVQRTILASALLSALAPFSFAQSTGAQPAATVVVTASPFNAAEGDQILTPAKVLAGDELRSKLVGLVQAPATKIAQLSTAPAAKLARVFGAYAAKDAA